MPKYLLLENVKNLVGKRFKPAFDEWLKYLDSIGYNTYFKVLNSKDCGIPQNRERIFALSIRKDIDTNKFEFPHPFDTGIRLKHILDDVVPEKFYINSDVAKKCLQEMADNGTLDEEAKGYEATNKYPNNGVIFYGNIENIKPQAGGIFPMNPEKDGTSRTIKAQYGKTSVQNLQSTGTFGATGVLKHDRE